MNVILALFMTTMMTLSGCGFNAQHETRSTVEMPKENNGKAYYDAVTTESIALEKKIQAISAALAVAARVSEIKIAAPAGFVYENIQLTKKPENSKKKGAPPTD